jgi:sensor domain CHASE-containing protein
MDAKTAAAADQIATNIKSAVDQQMNMLDRMARNGTDNPDTNLVAWQTDAASLFDDSKELGCESISLIDVVDSKFTTRWVYPAQEGSVAVGFDHASEPRRREAIETARAKNGPELTSLPESIGQKRNYGFVIYSPIGRR